MARKTYYIEYTPNLAVALDRIEINFPCFLNYDFIEMNYMEVVVDARIEDLKHIEKILAPFV